MGPLTEAELGARLATPQVRKYAKAVDRESAREKLAANADKESDRESASGHTASAPTRAKTETPSTFEKILESPLTRSVANQLTRSLMGALLGPTRRRRY
jgi:hypothetical protein